MGHALAGPFGSGDFRSLGALLAAPSSWPADAPAPSWVRTKDALARVRDTFRRGRRENGELESAPEGTQHDLAGPEGRVTGSGAATATAPALEPGTVLAGTYRIVAPVACGGMGEIYEATHERLPGRFAIKVLHRSHAHDEDAYLRFCREAAVLSMLRHPNIVQVFDFNITEGGTPYLVMELLDGRDLGQLLRRGPLPLRQVARIVRQVASALEAAHARGIVHRDLKPENVMLLELEGQPDFVKVLDFGISKARWTHRLTGDTTVMGTPEYMAPEQAQGHREAVDARTDQFALAAMTYTLLTGREPFQGDCSVTVLYQVVHEEPPALATLVEWPTGEIEAVLRKGMAKRRRDRYASVLEYARALEDAIASVLEARPDLEVQPVAVGERSVVIGKPRRRAVSGLATIRALDEARPTVKARRVPPRLVAGAAVLAAVLAGLFGAHSAAQPTAQAHAGEAPADASVRPSFGQRVRSALSWASPLDVAGGVPAPVTVPEGIGLPPMSDGVLQNLDTLETLMPAAGGLAGAAGSEMP